MFNLCSLNVSVDYLVMTKRQLITDAVDFCCDEGSCAGNNGLREPCGWCSQHSTSGILDQNWLTEKSCNYAAKHEPLQ